MIKLDFNKFYKVSDIDLSDIELPIKEENIKMMIDNINYELNSVLAKIDIYDKYEHTMLTLRDKEVHLLHDYIKTQEQKIKQLRDLSIYLDKELTNMTKEIEEIEL